MEVDTRTLTWSADSAEALAGEVEAIAPNWALARRNLPPDQYEAMRAELLELVRRRGGEGPTEVEHEYAVIVARRRG